MRDPQERGKCWKVLPRHSFMRIECKFQKSHKKLHVSRNSLLLWYSILNQMVLFLKATYRFLKISMKRTEKYFRIEHVIFGGTTIFRCESIIVADRCTGVFQSKSVHFGERLISGKNTFLAWNIPNHRT